jgi:hypothetical protein
MRRNLPKNVAGAAIAASLALSGCRGVLKPRDSAGTPPTEIPHNRETPQDGKIVVGATEGEGQVTLETYLRDNFADMIAREPDNDLKIRGYRGDQLNQQGDPVTLGDILYDMGLTPEDTGTVVSLHFVYPEGVRPYFAQEGILDEQGYGYVLTVQPDHFTTSLQMTGGDPGNGFLVAVYQPGINRAAVTEGPAQSWMRERQQNNPGWDK